MTPNLIDYESATSAFCWDEALRSLDGLPGGRGLNMAYEAVDRHASGSRGEHVALRFLSKTGAARDLTYHGLHRETNRFANILRGLGIGKGDRVFKWIPELYIAALGTLKNGSVICPLFSAFGRSRYKLGFPLVKQMFS